MASARFSEEARAWHKAWSDAQASACGGVRLLSDKSRVHLVILSMRISISSSQSDMSPDHCKETYDLSDSEADCARTTDDSSKIEGGIEETSQKDEFNEPKKGSRQSCRS